MNFDKEENRHEKKIVLGGFLKAKPHHAGGGKERRSSLRLR